MKYLAVVLVSVGLVACGGGGSDATTTVKPNGTGIAFQSGDSLTYSSTKSPTGTTTGAPTAVLQTRTVTDVKADGSYTRLSTFSDATKWRSQNFTTSGEETAYQNGDMSCTNSPRATSFPTPLSVGQTWNTAWTRTCITATTSTSTTNTSKGSVTGTETITTQAGTFNTHKLVYVDEINSSTGKTTYAYTCWRDRDLDRTVLCEIASSFLRTNETTPTGTYAEVQKLIGIDVSAFAGSRPIVERFAGNWSLNWTGTMPGRCWNVVVSVTGRISGSCEPASPPYSTWTLSGTVDANGNLQANITSGATLSGKFNSPVDASGTWSNSGGASGTWTAGHL